MLPINPSEDYARAFNARGFRVEQRGKSQRYYLTSCGEPVGERHGYSRAGEVDDAMDAITRADLRAGAVV